MNFHLKNIFSFIQTGIAIEVFYFRIQLAIDCINSYVASYLSTDLPGLLHANPTLKDDCDAIFLDYFLVIYHMR